MAVGGKSMLSTANYEARKFGVVSAMPGYIALKLCPQLQIVEPNFAKYKKAASVFHEVFRRYDESFSYFTLDEATLDVTSKIAELGLTAQELVAKMRMEVFQESGLTCSAGIAPNKMLAKVASNIQKPNGQYFVEGNRAKVIDFIRGTKLSRINGIGKVTAMVLEGVLGASTVGQLWEQRVWGKLLFSEIQSDFLLRCCLGVGSANNSDHESERQSLSVERTFPTITDLDKMFQVLSDLCLELFKQLELEGLAGKNVGIKMKASDFSTTTRAVTLKRFIWTEADIFNQAKQLLAKFHPPDLRLLGVRLASLDHIEAVTPEESIENFVSKTDKAKGLAKCPVCLVAIPGAPEQDDSESVQKTISDHVDLCLAKGYDVDSSQPDSKPKPFPQSDGPIKRKPRQESSLDRFLKKAK
jgi:nucleotidyltransferase/DNA polymerase involved in DNA repair